MNRLSPEKAKAIAAEYVTNGYKRPEALMTCGYKSSYAHKGGLKLWQNVVLREAIAKAEANLRAKSDVTVDSIVNELQECKGLAVNKGDLSTAARCIELKGKTIAAFTDNVNTTDLTKQKQLAAEEAAEARRIAHIRIMDDNKAKVG